MIKKKMIHSSNDFEKFIALVDENPNRFSETIKQLVAIQKVMLKKFDFVDEKGEKAIEWIEKYCILSEGEHAGENIKLMLWQKWYIYYIFSFYGNFEMEKFDSDGNFIGYEKRYLRVVRDVLLCIASGNSKTTFMGCINAYILYSKDFAAPKIYIGSNGQKQSLLCFKCTHEIIRKNFTLKKYANLRTSMHEIEIPRKNALLMAMSSDGKNYEGIIPTVIMIDETHEMKTSKYANDLRKSVKREDAFIFETTTMGTVRGGYLDDRVEYARKVLSGEVINYRFAPIIFEQDSEKEVYKALEENDIQVYQKSNPSLGVAVSPKLLKEKVQETIDNPSTRAQVLTKNFNIPQTPHMVFLEKTECEAKQFDEMLFQGQPIWIGIDYAPTRHPQSDLTNIKIATINPVTMERFIKSIYLMPKTYRDNENDEFDMLKEKSIHDRIDYSKFVENGDIIVLDCFAITWENIIRYIDTFILRHQISGIKKIGVDPSRLADLVSYYNIKTQDNKFCIPVYMERRKWNTPRFESIKNLRSDEKVYCNNKLDIIQNANTIAKYDSNNFMIIDTLEKRLHNDSLSAELGLETAIEVWCNAKNEFEERNIETLQREFIANKIDFEKYKKGE